MAGRLSACTPRAAVSLNTRSHAQSTGERCVTLPASQGQYASGHAAESILLFSYTHNLVGLVRSRFFTTDREMPNCPKCDKPVYFAERKTSLGKDWHGSCLRCEKCNKTLTPGGHAEHEGKPYCNHPCYSALFGPGGFGRGGAESYVYNK